ncbi:hypothetical protein STANM309S_02296 [Streptomyces tanashiensis]
MAEEAGLDSVWLAEHHFVPYGVCPSAVTLAALLLGRTRRLRVGTAVSVLPTVHPVALGEQAALLHLTSGGRFTLGVGRGGPWVDLEVFGAGLEAYEKGFPESLDLLLRWLTEPRVGAAGERFAFREVPVVPRPDELIGGAASRGGGGLHLAEERAARGRARTADAARHALRRRGQGRDGRSLGPVRAGGRAGPGRRSARTAAGHVSAGVAQLADRRADAAEALVKAMPGWLRQGLDAHVTVDGRHRAMRDPVAYTELLCGLHPVGTPRLAADRLAATAERTGITRFALLAEGSGDLAATEENVPAPGRGGPAAPGVERSRPGLCCRSGTCRRRCASARIGRVLPRCRSGSTMSQQSRSSGDSFSSCPRTDVKRASRSSTDGSSGKTATR